MKRSSKLILSSLIGIAVILFVLNKKNKQTEMAASDAPSAIESDEATQVAGAPTSSSPKPAATTAPGKTSAPAVKNTGTNQKEETSPAEGPLSVQEVESVNHIVKTISQAIAKKSNSNQFMKAIQALHLRPKFIDEGSNALGSMVTVRTHDALEGTRYLHGQFTGEKNNADYLQHVSFQIRPGSNSFQKAVEILNQYLPKNKTVKESASDYVLYSTDDGYVAWAKIATREDLKANKYNASSKEDVGSVIVTIEQDIHDMDDDGRSH